MHKFTKKDPTGQISNIRRQSPTEDILHQYFISSYFRTSLGFPQLRKKFRRQEKPKTFSSPTPLTYADSDSNVVSQDTSLINAKLNNPQNVFIKNTFSPSISLDNVQENEDEPPNNVKGFYFIRRSETNNLALQTPVTKCRNNKACHISEVMYYNRSICRDSIDLRKKNSKAFGDDSHSKPPPVPTIVVQRASITESLSSYNLSTPNNGDNYVVIENRVMNAYEDVQNLQSEGSEVQHSKADSSHANKEGEGSTAPNVIPNTSVLDLPYPAYPILDNGHQTSDNYSMHDQTAPNIDEAKYTFLSSLLNDSGSNEIAATKPSSNSNTIQPANIHLDNQLVNKPFYALTPNEQKYSNGPYDAQYYSHTGDSVMQRDNSNISGESAGKIITPEDTEDIVTTNAAFDNDDDDNYNDNETPASVAPIIQYQLTTYSVTSVSRNDATDENANNASANANETKDINISRDNDKNNAHPESSLSNTQRREPSTESDMTYLKPPPPPTSLTDILIATGQIDVANQTLAVRRANAFPEAESPKSPTRKFGLNKIKKRPKISEPVLVSSTSNIKTVPIVHLKPDENPKTSNKPQIDVGITKSIKKFRETFAQEEPKRALNISEPEVLMTPSLCKYFSEETLRRRFHIDTPMPIHEMRPARAATEHSAPDKQLPDLPRAYNDRIAQGKNSGELLRDINTIKYHAEGVKKFASVPPKETTAENTDPVKEEAGRAYALRVPPTTPVSPYFTIANESTFGRQFSLKQRAVTEKEEKDGKDEKEEKDEKDEKDGTPRRKQESTVAAKIFSALNNFADRNATAKYEPDLSDRADHHVRDKRGRRANASKDRKRRKRSFVKNTIIIAQRPDDTQDSLGTTNLDPSDGSANNNNRATIGSQGREWLLAQCVTKDADVPTTKSTNKLTTDTEEKAINYHNTDSLYDQGLRSSSESLFDLYRYSEEKRDSTEISSASLQNQDKNRGQHGETNDIWRVVNGLRLSSHVSQDNRNVYQRDTAGVENDAYYKTTRNEDAASFYRSDSYRDTFTPPPLRSVVKPHSPASNTMSSDYFLPKLGTIYGSAAARI